MAPPARTPIGLRLAQTAKVVSRAFDDTLEAAGGATATWLVLVSLKSQPVASQRELAQAVGIEGPTLTHHLNAMEAAGLVTRRRDPANRRLHLVEVTEAGDAMFHQLRNAAAAFDKRLRNGLKGTDIERLETLLERLHANVGPSPVEEQRGV